MLIVTVSWWKVVVVDRGDYERGWRVGGGGGDVGRGDDGKIR